MTFEHGPCEETFAMVADEYLRCGRPAVVLVQHRGRDEGPYRMCLECGDHNIANRDAQALAVADDVAGDVRARWHVPPPPRAVLLTSSRALLEPVPTDRASLAAAARTWAEKVQQLKVVDNASYIAAQHLLLSIKLQRNQVEKFFAKHLEAAQETKRKAEAARKGLADDQAVMESPLALAETKIKQALLEYDDAKERARVAEEQRLQAVATQRAVDLTLDGAAALELAASATGDDGMRQEAQDIIAQPIDAPVVVVKKDAPRVHGITYRDNWKPHPTVDIRTLARAVADGKVPTTFLSANMIALKGVAGPEAKVPGVRFFNDRYVVSKL